MQGPYRGLLHLFSARTSLPSVCLAAFLAAFALPASGASTGAPSLSEPRATYVVLYANETPSDAGTTTNYSLLFDALRSAGRADAEKTIKILKDDARNFSALVDRQIASILAEARHGRFHAVIFTNNLARRGRFLLARAAREPSEEAAFADLTPADTEILRSSPLSRPEALRSALGMLSALPNAETSDFALITSSHGDADTVIMPRVFADFSSVDRETLVRALTVPQDRGESGASGLARFGISKVEYWDALARGAPELRFPLVVRESCKSGILTWREFSAIPMAVGVVAHSGNRNIKIDHLDYARLFADLAPSESVAEQLEVRLRAQKLHVDNRYGIFFRLARRHVAGILPFALFVPLAVWLIWYWRRSFASRTSS